MILLYQLEGFYRVAKAGGYARAAREFPYPITQPGVHAQVRRLEREMGVRLLEQIAKDRTIPTRAGRELLAFCTPFFEGIGDAVRRVSRSEGGGAVRIEAGALEIQEILPAWVRRVRAAHPEIEIELREIDTPDSRRLLDDHVDLIVDHQVDVPAGVSARLVGRHRSFLVTPSHHPLAKKGGASLRAFAREPFVCLNANLPQHALQVAALRRAGAEPARITRAPSVASILSFVAAGVGYSLIPWPTAAGPKMRDVTVVPLHGKDTTFPVLASFRKRAEPDVVLDAVLQLSPKG